MKCLVAFVLLASLPTLSPVAARAATPDQASAILSYGFDRAGDAEGWLANGDLREVSVARGMLSCRGAGPDPILELQTRLDLPATPWQGVELWLSADRDGSAELFWSNTDRGRFGGFAQDKSMRFPVRGDGETRVYRLQPFWHPEGRLVRLRLDLYDGATFQLDSIRILERPVPAAPREADFTFVGTDAGWWRDDGAKVGTTASGLAIQVGSEQDRVFAPPVVFEASAHPFVALRMAVDRGRRATLFFATAEASGLHRLSFPVRADGREHTYNLDLLASTAWRGRVIALGLQPSDEAGTRATLGWLRASATPLGAPELDSLRLDVDEVRPRVGRPVLLAARFGNAGGESASNLVANLQLPPGLRLVSGSPRIEKASLAFGEEVEWRWQVHGEAPLRQAVILNVTASNAPAVRRETVLDLSRPPNLAMPDGDLPAPRPVRGPFEVGVYYFPGWRTASQWHPIERFPERRPVLGWYREGDPEVADWHIRWAVEHGITFFAYDWYWSRGDRQLEHALHDGYFRARHKSLLKFCLLWANHNAPGTSSADDCLAVTRFWIDHYFRRPEHLRFEGKPVVIIFSVDRLSADLGSEGVRESLDAMRAECAAAGLGGLYVIGCVADTGGARQCAKEGYDAVTAYTWPHLGVPEGQWYAPFETLLEGYRRNWTHLADDAGIPLLPPVSGGWDSRPWHGENHWVRFGRTPELFRRHLRDARAFLETRAPTNSAPLPVAGRRARPGSILPMILIEAWNEFGEGAYIEPHREFGFEYLDAIRDVFGGTADGEHQDLVPADVGRGPYDVPPSEPGRTSWAFDRVNEGWDTVMDLADLSVRDGVLAARSTGRDPAFFGPGMQARAADFDRVTMRLRLTPNDGVPFGDRAQLFWRTSTSSESEATSERFDVQADGTWHEYSVPVRANPRWRGIVTRLRLDPVNRPNIQVEVDSLGLAR